jgi:tryptophan-rich hypothetical protein
LSHDIASAGLAPRWARGIIGAMKREAPDPPRPQAARNPLSPKKLLLSKWTAVAPRDKEKHFVVVRVLEPVAPALRIEEVELQAVHSGRVQVLPWRELKDASRWRQGWV